MNFITFPVGATNIFPLANSTVGGQLLTEFNLRSRESVGTSPDVKYMIGPSFTHSDTDFAISSDGATIKISGGRAVVNGHYVELVDVQQGQQFSMNIDLNEANLELKTSGLDVLKGDLCVGIRAMYSTLETLAARADAMEIENNDGFYEGVQIVILPKSGPLGKRFTLPDDSPTDVSKVNAHLKLGEFSFVNGVIVSVSQNSAKTQHIDASRIMNVAKLLSDSYVKKTGLNSKLLYTFAGKGTDPTTGLDTWCDSTDSLMVWDSNPNLVTGDLPDVYPEEAEFLYNNATGHTYLVLPHKQVDGMKSTDGQNQYYAEKYYRLPIADYGRGTGGTVDRQFINKIKDISDKLDTIYSLPSGRLRKYIAEISSVEDRVDKIKVGTPIQSGWSVGDYILVGIDRSIEYTDTSLYFRSPSTLYVVVPGVVSDVGKVTEAAVKDGVLLGTRSVTKTEYGSDIDRNEARQILGIEDGSNVDRAEVGVGYYIIELKGDEATDVTKYYYQVTGASALGYTGIIEGTDPIVLTGSVPLATEDAVGGFLNASDDDVGLGYIRRNDDGKLEIIDWELLISGVLAYQLGQNIEIPKGYSIAEIQNQLNEYVNERVAFPNTAHIAHCAESGADLDVINVVVHLPDVDSESVEAATLHIHDLDSRFGTSVYLHIDGQAPDNMTIIVSGCEKLRLDLAQIQGTPDIILQDVNLYYDADVLSNVDKISGLKLWYKQFSSNDANLIVDGMTVMLGERPERVTNDDYWTVGAPNDNHYSYALRSITFNHEGFVIGCSMLVGDNITSNVEYGTYASVFNFVLPQSTGLPYPESRLNKQLKVTGEFVTAYATRSPEGYTMKDTRFTALTQAYDSKNAAPYVSGNIAFYTTTTHITAVSGVDYPQSIDCWEGGKFHVFYGGTAE